MQVNVRFGSERDIATDQLNSALPPKADIDERWFDVRFVPKADIGVSFNDFIGTGR